MGASDKDALFFCLSLTGCLNVTDKKPYLIDTNDVTVFTISRLNKSDRK